MLKKVIFPAAALAVLLVLLISLSGGASKNKSDATRENENAPKIDISLPVTMSKCAPCHDSLDRVEYETIRIPHYFHLKKGVPCQACHNTDLPHDAGKLNKPTMDACFNCHGLNHGPQGLMAPTNCDKCHPGNFDLVPGNHTAEWKQSGHENEEAQSKQRCVMCHQGERNTCKTCHINDEDLPMTLKMNTESKVNPANNKRYVVDTAGAVNVSKCNPCHDNWDRVEYEKTRFYHSKHFARGVKCGFCHQDFPHRRGYIDKPEMQKCFTCHSTEHGPEGDQLAPGDCMVCHRPGMNLIPDFHTVAFKGGEHRNWAREDRSLCRMCHVQGFCDNCHILGIDYIPHRFPGWLYEHGTVANSNAALDGKGNFACFRCHLPNGPVYPYQSAPSCASCHKAVVFPHIQPWAPTHGKTAVKVGKDACYTCHRNAQICEGCHQGVEMPHASDWIGKHRIFLQNQPISLCLNCHQKTQCEQCHAVHKVHNQHTNFDFSELGGRQ